jgi:hypothetical protein
MLVAVSGTIGCASSNITERERHYEGGPLQKPGRIIVYNFAASPDEIPADAAISGHYQRHTAPQTMYIRVTHNQYERIQYANQ